MTSPDKLCLYHQLNLIPKDCQLSCYNFQILNYLKSIFGSDSYRITFTNNEISIFVQPSKVTEIIDFLQNSQIPNCYTVSDITAVDTLHTGHRISLVYLLVNTTNGHRINLYTFMGLPGVAQSLTYAKKYIGWGEREAAELFGLYFAGHPDLRRLLTDYGFAGYPLRKDFPLTGYYELAYSEVTKMVISSRVSLSQEFRSFAYAYVWGPKTSDITC